MTRLADRQQAFAAALLDATRPVPRGIIEPGGAESLRRFSVYRNNVVVGLIDTLSDAYPAVLRLVGKDFFRAMAGAYVRLSPPKSPIMLGYGEGFPDFIRTFQPAAGLPYLADVARIEWAWRDAYHAREAVPLDRDSFKEIPVEDLPSLRLHLHPSLRVVRSTTPALTIWRMNVEADSAPGPIILDDRGEDTLIIRPEATVEVRLMPPGAAEFVAALSKGWSISDAAECASACDPRFDLSGNIGELIAAGTFVAYETGACPGPKGMTSHDR